MSEKKKLSSDIPLFWISVSKPQREDHPKLGDSGVLLATLTSVGSLEGAVPLTRVQGREQGAKPLCRVHSVKIAVLRCLMGQWQ